jgi:hypothetical protein
LCCKSLGRGSSIQAERFLYRSTLGSSVVQKKKRGRGAPGDDLFPMAVPLRFPVAVAPRQLLAVVPRLPVAVPSLAKGLRFGGWSLRGWSLKCRVRHLGFSPSPSSASDRVATEHVCGLGFEVDSKCGFGNLVFIVWGREPQLLRI